MLGMLFIARIDKRRLEEIHVLSFLSIPLTGTPFRSDFYLMNC